MVEIGDRVARVDGSFVLTTRSGCLATVHGPLGLPGRCGVEPSLFCLLPSLSPSPMVHLTSVEVEQHVYKADVEGNVLTLTS